VVDKVVLEQDFAEHFDFTVSAFHESLIPPQMSSGAPVIWSYAKLGPQYYDKGPPHHNPTDMYEMLRGKS
jgi:hypothetical protein